MWDTQRNVEWKKAKNEKKISRDTGIAAYSGIYIELQSEREREKEKKAQQQQTNK